MPDWKHLHLMLVEARDGVRTADEYLARAKAEAESRCVALYSDEKAMGSNEAARRRTLDLFLADDDVYGTAAFEWRAAHRLLDMAQNALEAELALDRELSRESRDRQTEALLALGSLADARSEGSLAALLDAKLDRFLGALVGMEQHLADLSNRYSP